MRAASIRQSHCLRVTGLLLVLPFLLLSLIAPGFMPVRGADGGMAIVICADGAMAEIIVDAATGQPMPDAVPQDGRCAWAQAGVVVAVLAQPDLPVPAIVARAFHPVAPDDLWRPAHDPRGLWARGPPETV